MANKPVTFGVGPFVGVRSTENPYDDQGPNVAGDALNVYLQDAVSGGGLWQRPGSTNPVDVTGVTAGGLYCHTMHDGTVYNFVVTGDGVAAQKLYRWASMGGSVVDVTPVAVTIAPTARVYFNSLNDTLIVSDGVNRPWIGTNLGATPITGTYIDFDGAGTAWNAFGRPGVYTGSLFFILNTLNAVSFRSSIAWSEPNLPATGYQQAGYDNVWELTQTGSTPLYALHPENECLYYFRQFSIGALAGAPNINFQNTATHDVVSGNVGCVESATIAPFLNYVYFADQNGRPYRFAVGGVPEPIWQQVSSLYAAADYLTTPNPADEGQWFGLVEPNLNVYLLTHLALDFSPRFVVFDAATGRYAGTWQFESEFVLDGAILWDATTSTTGGPHLGMIGLESGGFVSLVKLAVVSDNLWTDGGLAMSVTVRSAKMGYDAKEAYTFPEARAVVAYSGAGFALGAQFFTSQMNATSTGVGPAGPPESPVRRVTFPLDKLMGRDVSMAMTGEMTEGQLRIYRMEVDAVPGAQMTLQDW